MNYYYSRVVFFLATLIRYTVGKRYFKHMSQDAYLFRVHHEICIYKTYSFKL